MDDYNRTLIALVLGNMFVNTGISIIMSGIIGRFNAGPALTLFISLFVSLVILLICGEVTPKTLAILNAEKVSDFIAPILWYYRLSIMPLILTIEKIHSVLWKIAGRKTQRPLSHDEYYAFAEMARDVEAFSEHEHTLLKNILELSELEALFLAKSRAKIHCVNCDMSQGEVADAIRTSRQKFLPVIKKSIDDTVSILSARDFMRIPFEKRAEWSVQNCVFDAVFIPEKAVLQNALSVFIHKRIPTALTIDKFGYITGMLCKKNIYETIVGDIREEFEKPEWKIKNNETEV
jgi:CBS domain containing-hemolysin-like protein